MNRVCFVVLVGIPGAGKTTFCENFARNESDSSIEVVHVCFDRFVKLDCNADLESGVFKEKRKQLLKSLGRIIEIIKLHDQIALKGANEELNHKFGEIIPINLDYEPNEKIYSIFLDDNMYYRSMRYEVFSLARKYQVGYLQLHFNVPVEVAKARNANRANPIPDEIISNMWIKFEKPNKHFYRWERNTVELTENSNLETIAEIKQLILLCSNNPEMPIECDTCERQPVEQSKLHKVDLLLRKAVSDVIKKRKTILSSVDLKVLSEQLVTRRKAILDDLKMGLIDVDPHCTTSEQIESLF